MLDNQTLQYKYPHLEVSVLKLSEVKKDNESFRIDSEYFKKEYLTKKAKLLPISTKLKNLMTSGYYGILPKSDDYLDEGLNLIRGKDVRDSSLEISNLVKVPHSYFQERYCVHKNDILFLVKGATIGYSDGVLLIIDEPSEKMIFNGSVFKLQVKNINPFYLYAFMMTHYFTFQKLREVANNGIEYNSLPTIKNFLIPILPMSFQLEIEKLVKDSHQALECSKALYKEAEALLYEALGLDSKNPLQSILESKITDYHDLQGKSCDDNALSPNYTIATLKESFLKTGRLDAEYYQSKYEDIEIFIKNYGYVTLQDLEIQDKNYTPKQEKQYHYIELANIGSNGNISTPTQDFGKNLPTRARRIVKEGDVIISSVEGSLSSCALITKEFDSCLVSTGFYVLRSKHINGETLLVLFKSEFFQDYLKKFPSGTILSAISKEELQNILIPKIDSTTQTQIAAHIQKSFELRAEAKSLLESAKFKVESALNNANNGGGGG
ncbi:restriction endonuclease subunit S [uncultured Helicobacter sp.]|uniref:restriction endonuclease subunit S n=1 Tax=uncultured Helicobacter sp. TaxID=175537 RepID=UPI00374F13D2